ncbi:hypothetical protein IVB12_04700 [Bradyrhizobium sp. 179]|nr:hypothetical protein [Bradyrhizobium sp. 179]
MNEDEQKPTYLTDRCSQAADVYISPVNLTANGRTDGFENHVLVRAARENIDPSDMAHGFHVKILDDLASVGIVFDHSTIQRMAAICSDLRMSATP